MAKKETLSDEKAVEETKALENAAADEAEKVTEAAKTEEVSEAKKANSKSNEDAVKEKKAKRSKKKVEEGNEEKSDKAVEKKGKDEVKESDESKEKKKTKGAGKSKDAKKAKESKKAEKPEKPKNPIDAKIDELNAKKRELIYKVKNATKQLKYKKIELEALVKILKDYDESKVQKLQRRLKSLEFKIATRALNNKAERELVKRIMVIEKELAQFRPMMKAKKRRKFLEEDVSKLEEEIKDLESKLKEIREELRGLFRKKKTEEIAKKRGVSISDEREELVTLGDIIVMEEE